MHMIILILLNLDIFLSRLYTYAQFALIIVYSFITSLRNLLISCFLLALTDNHLHYKFIYVSKYIQLITYMNFCLYAEFVLIVKHILNDSIIIIQI